MGPTVEISPWDLGCYEILAAGMFVVAVAYVIWFFVDYAATEQ